MMRKILFQGDSVTDAGRREDPSGLGNGYPQMIADYLSREGDAVTVINRGISGNRSRDLIVRWKEDCLDLHHPWISPLPKWFLVLPQQHFFHLAYAEVRARVSHLPSG